MESLLFVLLATLVASLFAGVADADHILRGAAWAAAPVVGCFALAAVIVALTHGLN